MANEADIAEASIEIHLAAARLRRLPVLPHTGRCHNCDAEVGESLFCDQDCRDDWQRRERGKGVRS